MTRGPEATLEDKCVTRAKRYGWRVRKVTFICCKGCPDRLYGRKGVAIWIEFKQAGAEPNRQQLERARELREDYGYRVEWADDYADFCRILGIPQ